MNDFTSIKEALAFLLEEKKELLKDKQSWYEGMKREDKAFAESLIAEYQAKIDRIDGLTQALKGGI